MNAKQELEKLSHRWYGYAVCASLFSLFGLRASGMIAFALGVGIWAVINGVFLALTLAVMMFLGSRLQARSSGTRTFLLVASGLFTVLGVLGFLSEGRAFLHFWSFGLLLQMAATAVSVWMNAQSLAILRSSKVRAYFG